MKKFERWKRRVAIVLGVGTNGRSTSLNRLRGNGHIIALIWKLAIATPHTWFTREYVLPPAPKTPDAPQVIADKCRPPPPPLTPRRMMQACRRTTKSSNRACGNQKASAGQRGWLLHSLVVSSNSLIYRRCINIYMQLPKHLVLVN